MLSLSPTTLTFFLIELVKIVMNQAEAKYDELIISSLKCEWRSRNNRGRGTSKIISKSQSGIKCTSKRKMRVRGSVCFQVGVRVEE